MSVTQEQVAAYKINRTGWASGPWDQEPDRVDFRHVGFPCLMLRNSRGHWCGYVGVSPSHPDYGKKYNEVDVECHGGLTYEGHCAGNICHVPQPGEPDEVYWFGFDCHHAWDAAPGDRYTYDDATYRNADYVRYEVQQLAEQLAQRGEAHEPTI